MADNPHYKKNIQKIEAENYESKRFSSTRMRRLDKMEKEFAQSISNRLPNGSAILDIPCGSGRFFEIFSPAKELYLFDYAQEMISALLAKRPEAAKRQAKVADILAIPLADNSVDLAFSMRLFHHFPTDEIRMKALKELTRVSRKYVAFSFYCKENWRYLKKRLRNRDTKHNVVSFRQMIIEAESCGLRLIQKKPIISLIEQQRCLLFEKFAS